MRIIRKNYTVFVIFSAIILSASALFCIIIGSNPVKIIAAASAVSVEAAVFIRFYSIKIFVVNDCLTIKSGVIFKSVKTVPLGKILLKKRYSVGKNVFLTTIRTAGSFTAVYGEL